MTRDDAETAPRATADVAREIPLLARMPQRFRAAAATRPTGARLEELNQTDAALDEQAQAEMREAQRQFRQQAWTESIRRASRYETASLDRLYPQQDPDGKVTRWLASGKRNLVLKGESSRGKTHAAYAIGNAASAAGLWTVGWRFSDLLRELRPNGLDPDRSAAEDAWMHVTSCDILILDDFGGEAKNSASEWVPAQAVDILDARARNERRTVITTNLSGREIRARYGDPVTNRIMERAEAALIDGDVIEPPDPF